MADNLTSIVDSNTPIFNANYPIAEEALANSIQGVGDLKRFHKIIPVIQSCIEAGEIVSNQVDDVKYALGGFVKAAYQIKIASIYLYAGKWENQVEELRYPDFPDTPRLVSSFAKKLKKMSLVAQSTQMFKDMVNLTDELGNLAEVAAWLKENTIKSSVKKAAAKESEKEAYDKKYTSHEDVQAVVSLLKENAANIEHDLYKNQLKSLEGVVEHYKKMIDETNVSDYRKLYAKNPFYAITLQGITTRVHEISPFMLSRNDPVVFSLDDDYQQKLEKSAKVTAAEIVDHFVYKNSGKLAHILWSKNNLDKVSIENINLNNGAVECDVVCSFKDESSFRATSSIVFAISVLGNGFYRYPTLFKDVSLPDGSKMVGATEQKMDEVFSIATTADDADNKTKKRAGLRF